MLATAAPLHADELISIHGAMVAAEPVNAAAAQIKKTRGWISES